MMYLKKILSRDDIEACLRLCDKALASTEDALQRWRIERMRGIMNYCADYRTAPSCMLKYLEKGKLTPQDHRKVRQWIEKVSVVMREHLALDDDVFPADLTERMRRRYLGEI